MTRDAEALPRRHGHGHVGGARNFVVRIARAWGALKPEQRLAALAALSLWVTMLLPWYSKSVTLVVKGAAKATDQSYSAYGAFSFVEAAVLLVSAGLLVMLFARGERRAFHLPGGDGFVVMLGGIWTGVLIFYRMLDKPGTTGTDRITATVGLRWGIFLALIAAIWLAYAGVRMRAAHRPEPSLEADPTRPPAARAPADATRESIRPRYPPRPTRSSPSTAAPRLADSPTERTRRIVTRDDAEQLSFDDAPPSEPDPFGERRR
jgi:hypothetical protein